MADYVERVKVVADIEADTSKIDQVLDRLEKPITVQLDVEDKGIFQNVQQDIKKIQQSVSRINVEGLSTAISNALKKGATEGTRALENTVNNTNTKKTVSDLSKAQSELNKVHTTLVGLSKGVGLSSLEEAGRQSVFLATDVKQAVGEIKNLQSALSAVKTPKELEKVLNNIKSSLKGIGGEDLEKVFTDYYNSGLKGNEQYIESLKKLKSVRQEIAQLTGSSTSKSSISSELNKATQEAKQLENVLDQIIGKTSSGKTVTFGDSIKSMYNDLTQLNSKLSSIIQKDDKDNFSLKVTVSGVDELIAQINQANSATDSFEQNLKALNGITLFQGIENQFKDISSNISNLVKDIQSLKASLESISTSIKIPEVDNTEYKKARVSKYAISNDEFEAVEEIARKNATNLFNQKGFSYLDLETKQLESGLARVSAKIKTVEGEWRSFSATITNTGDLINQKFKTVADPSKLDKQLSKLQTRDTNLTLQQQYDQVQKIRSALGLIENETWSIKVDSHGLVTIKNELASASDGAAQAVQNFKSAEEAIQQFNQAAKQSSVTLSQTTSKSKSSDTLPNVKELKDQTKQLEAITRALDTNQLLARTSSIRKNYQGYANLGLSSQNLDTQIKSIEKYMSVLNELNRQSKLANSLGGTLNSQGISDMVDSYEQLTKAMNTAENEIKSLKNAYGGLTTEQQRANASNSMLKWLEQNSRAVKEYGDEIKQLANDVQSAYTKMDFDQITARMSNIKLDAFNRGMTGKSWTESLKNGLGTITQLFGSYSLIDRADDIAREMVSTIHDVDDALTDLKMATGVSDTQANQLMETYSEMGKTLKATGVDVATAATEFMKQGKSIEESADLAEDSIVLSKIGDLTSEESTKYLTSAMKGYKVEAEDALSIVDKLSAVDLVSATDVGGLAEGMSEVASTADLAGVSMDRLLAYLATVGEVTQEGMSSVGNSFNAIFARMGNIKLSRLKDYQNNLGEDLSNVETVLRGEGINLRDETGDFRNFGEVLDEVAANWENYSSVSQSAIAQAFAGTHHRNNFIVLMQNYSTAMDYMDESLNSSGQALEKFSSYQDSLTGRIEDFRNSFQTLSNTIVGSDLLKGIVDGGTAALDVLDQLVSTLGVIPSLLMGAGIFQGIKGGGWSSQRIVCVSS